jgi:hypothetical protein
MKKSIVYCLLITVNGLLFNSCDYVSSPFLKSPTGSIVISSVNSVKTIDSTSNKKNVLVEDYTGEYCENCPFAAYELDTLIKTYGKRIVPLSVNTGSFADPSQVPSPYKSYDYTSPAGDIYGGQTAFNVQAFPNGFINRQGALTANPSPYSAWGGLVANSIANDTCFVQLKLSAQFDTITRNLSVTASGTFLKVLSGSYNLVVLLTEDSMMGPQNVGGSLHQNYAHRFVLHDAINSTWGDSLVSNGSAVNQTFTKTYTYTVLNKYPASSTAPLTCNYKQCSVIAYIYNSKLGSPSQYVVLQSLALKVYNK